MKISQPKCRYCGELRKNADDLNITKSFCIKCSGQRIILAKKAFSDRRPAIVAEGKYIVSKRLKK